MSQMKENQATGKSDSRSTMLASLAALGSVIVASSCCLPLLPFLFAAGAAGTSLCRPVAAVSTCSIRVAHCPWVLQIVAGEAMQLQAQLD
jgi:hypothetical protein